MNRRVLLSVATLLAVVVASAADAQQRGQRGQGRGRGGFSFRGGFGGGIDMLTLASVEAVQKEIEALEDQVSDIRKLREEQRAARRGGQRGQRGGQRGERGARGRRGEGGDGQRAQRGEGGGRRGRGQGEGGRRGGFGNFTPEQIAEFRRRQEQRAKEREQREKETEAELTEILLPHQMDRLKEIHLQQLDTNALRRTEVVAALKISPDQVEKMQKVRTDRVSGMREAVFQGDREGMRARMTEYNKETNTQVLAVLTAGQKTQFAAMKGEPFKMPENALRFGGRGRGGRGTGGGRPERPRRPDSGN